MAGDDGAGVVDSGIHVQVEPGDTDLGCDSGVGQHIQSGAIAISVRASYITIKTSQALVIRRAPASSYLRCAAQLSPRL